MKSRKLGLGLLAAAAAMMTMAFTASIASATVVEPAGGEVTLRSTNSAFITQNAFSQNYLHCPKSETKLKVPAEGGAEQKNNVNQEGSGTFSQTSGSVTAQLQQPTFEKEGETLCGVFSAPEKPAQRNPAVDERVAEVEVKQQKPEEPKEWTAAVQTVQQPGQEPPFKSIFSVSIPQEALEVIIKSGPAECVLLVSAKNQQSLVMGEFVKPNLFIDGQVQFDIKKNPLTCEGVFGINPAQPAQFEATYTDPEEKLQVKQAQ